MTTEAKPVRKVRFNLPEPKKEHPPPNGVRPTNRLQKQQSTTTVSKKSVVASTPSIIVNKNAIPTSRRASVGDQVGVKSLPKILDQRRPSTSKVSCDKVPKSSSQTVSRPKTSMTRSQSFANKKTHHNDHSKKRHSDGFLFDYSSVPLLQITDTDYQPIVYARPKVLTHLNPNFLKIPLPEDDNANYLLQCNSSDVNVDGVIKDMDRMALSQEKNETMFWDFVDKWRLNLTNNKFEQYKHVPPTPSVCKESSTKADPKSNLLQNTSRLKAFKMGLDQVQLVTQLLRACRDSNEPLLKDVFRQILSNGISKEELNISDKSGRTALSYICSTNLHKYIELMLQLPGIDVNKADNEGNTPLHFASQAGQAEAINLLITKSHHLTIDAKNNLGFTALMKAALQGRTKCAKLLLFAGASPLQVDPCRNLRADQWARFVGRHTTAEMIEECARSKLLGPSPSDLSEDQSNVFSRKRTDGSQDIKSSSFRSKFSKVFPFKFHLSNKEKPQPKTTCQRGKENSITKEINVSSKMSSNHHTHFSSNDGVINGIIHSQVPKLEITYAHNNALIKKYETIYGTHDDTNSKETKAVKESTKKKQKDLNNK